MWFYSIQKLYFEIIFNTFSIYTRCNKLISDVGNCFRDPNIPIYTVYILIYINSTIGSILYV